MYLLPFAALAMASCSSSEDAAVQSPVAQNNEVKIFPQVTGATRGVVETTASISQFNVILNGKFATTADADASGLVVGTYSTTATKSSSSWGLAQNYFWGDETTNAKFTAYANEGTATYSAGKLSGVTVEEDVDDQKDILVAYNEGNKTAFATGVPLHFRHAMSQIVVKASYADESDVTTYPLADYPSMTVKVKAIKFVNLNNSGTLTLPTASTASGEAYEPVWSGHSGAAEFAVQLDNPITLGSTATAIDLSESANPLLLLPQTTAATENLAPVAPATVTGAYMAVLVNIDYKESGADYYPKAEYSTDDGYAWVAVPVSIEWAGGSKYIYTLNFSNIALGAIAPGTAAGAIPGSKAVGDKLPSALLTKVNFLVTVEEAWIDGGSFTPAM